MKNLFFIFFLIPILGFSQSDTTLDYKNEVIMINQSGINDLVNKYKNILKKRGGVEGWRLQIKFTSKREDILPYQRSFTNLYPHITSQITFDSPYYKLTVGNFRTKNEALKVKYEIKKNFPGAYPISIIINPDLLKN